MSDKKKGFNLSDYELVTPYDQPEYNHQKSARVVKIKSIPRLNRELAIHEASHLVFNLIFEKLDLGFTKAESVTICSKKTIDGCVNGFCPYVAKTDPHLIDKFYEENPLRSLAKIISTAAGYASYQVFIDAKEENCIGVPGEKDTMIYYSMDKLPGNAHCQDIRWLRRRINKFRGKESVNPDENIKAIFTCVQEAMNITAIKSTIIYASRFLMKNDCKEVSGEDLDRLGFEIKRLTNKVDIHSMLQEIEQVVGIN